MAQQLILEWARETAPAFDNFLPGSNREVLAHLRELAEGTLAETSVLVWGVPGSGKSHMLAAALAEARARGRLAAAVRIEAERPPAAVAPGALYVLDDIDRLSATGQASLFTFYNACRDAGAQLLLSAGMPSAQAPLRDDLRTRVGWGLVLELKPLSDADKPAALAAYAREQGFHLASDVIDFLLTRGRRDMGALLSTLRALDRYSLSTKRPVTIPLVKELLQPDLLQTLTRMPMARADAGRLTLFDLDHTLLAGDSDYGWGEFLVRHGLVDAADYAQKNAAFYAAYQAGTLDQLAYLEFSLEPLTRFPMEELAAWHRKFMAEVIQPLMTAAGRELVADRLRAGDLVIIITSTNGFITGPIARAYGVEHLIATDPEMRAGRYTGRVAGIPAFREGKVSRLHSWLERRGQRLEDFAQSWFYSDSTNDLPLLEAVTHPVAVDPDGALRQIAERRRWPIITLRDQAPPPTCV